ncbi:alpha/beta hydrolase-fold protein [Clostridium sp. C2-6-12]|uniref:alpha/beta hydrolase n=1 Tax=Clostridium sp. C2-6-12 TaxID=2698832 RepID=UPI00136C97D7|nr:alpha/beta hydrolase-fold protein [Clostridium sp. C2-6-12]
MNNIKITSVPDEYKKAVDKELQGTINEVSYSVQNYINQSREFVTNQNISSREAGREVVEGISIEKKCNVYLPAGYKEDDKNKKYNVLYLLHGVGGNRHEWLGGNGTIDDNFIICNIFDNLIAKGDINPLIIVFPDGRSAHDWTDNSFNADGTNMLGFYYFDYELRYDLIPFIESKYNVYADIKDTSSKGIQYSRMHRAIAGLSMGGMQALNLIVGGHRCDSQLYTGTKGIWDNGLDKTVLAPGMEDLFAYIGAFSNAPTSSDGDVLGTSIKACDHRVRLLYITCGDADQIASSGGYAKATNGIVENAGDNLVNYFQVAIKDGIHDFNVWNNGAYNFARLAFEKNEEHLNPYVVSMMLDSY